MAKVDRVVIGVMSDEMDKAIPAFIIALGAKAYDMEVDMFFTFWVFRFCAIRRRRPVEKILSPGCSAGCCPRESAA